MNEIEREYGHLWDGTDPGWVLVRAQGHDDVEGIYNMDTRLMLVIEDDLVAEEVRNRMKKNNVPILDRIPPGDCVP